VLPSPLQDFATSLASVYLPPARHKLNLENATEDIAQALFAADKALHPGRYGVEFFDGLVWAEREYFRARAKAAVVTLDALALGRARSVTRAFVEHQMAAHDLNPATMDFCAMAAGLAVAEYPQALEQQYGALAALVKGTR